MYPREDSCTCRQLLLQHNLQGEKFSCPLQYLGSEITEQQPKAYRIKSPGGKEYGSCRGASHLFLPSESPTSPCSTDYVCPVVDPYLV